MRILIISNLYPPNVVGGYERLCFEVTSGLAALGHEMVVLTSDYGGQVAEFPRQRILRDLTLLTGQDIYVPFAGTAEDRRQINERNLQVLGEVIGRVQPDVIFAWNLFFLDASFLAELESSPCRTVVMLTDNWLLVMRNGGFVADFFRDYVHGPQRFLPGAAILNGGRAILPASIPVAGLDRRGGAFLTKLRRFFASRVPVRPAAAVPEPVSPPAPPPARLEAIFGSAFMRDLYAAGGTRFERDKVIHNGVRQSGHDGVDRAQLVNPRKLKLLFAGRLVDLKGAHTAVEALSLLDATALGVERVELTIVGDAQDAAYMDRLNATIEASPSAQNIILRPTVPEDALAYLFDEHDLYLFPSLYEPFSLTLIHAMACGIPTIASDIGGNPEIVEHGRSGLLFKKGDPADLAVAIGRLARDPALRRYVATGGQSAAHAFTFERMVSEMATFLKAAA